MHGCKGGQGVALDFADREEANMYSILAMSEMQQYSRQIGQICPMHVRNAG